MSILSNIEAIWQKDETWVLNFILELKTGFDAAESDLKAFWTWLAAHAGEISQDAQAVAGAVMTLKAAGIAVPSAVNRAVDAMNVAVSGLNAAVASAATGASTLNVVVAGYTAAKDAEAAHAQAAVAIVAPSTPSVAAPAPVAEPITAAAA